jgi:hypothetical protein
MYQDEIVVAVPNTFSEIWLLFWNASSESYSDLMQLQ